MVRLEEYGDETKANQCTRNLRHYIVYESPEETIVFCALFATGSCNMGKLYPDELS